MGEIRTDPLTPGVIFGRRVREERERQRLTQDDVVERLSNLGRPMDRSNLGRIERGDTTGQLDNLFALALALGVAPIHLMLPREEEELVAIAPKRTLAADEARSWVRGLKMLADSDPFAYFAAMPESDQRAVLAGAGPKISPLVAAASGLGWPDPTPEVRQLVEDTLAARATGRPRKSRKRQGGNDV